MSINVAQLLQRLLTIAVLTSLLVSPVAAVTRYVSPGGVDTANGLTPATAWRTIAKANSGAAPGDVVMIAAGTYAEFPAPAATPSASARIAYVGDLLNPGAAVISASGTVSKPYVTIKGVTLNAGFTVSGSRDSITDCRVFGGRSQIWAANDCLLARLTVTSDRFWVYGQETDSLVKANRDTIQDCTFNLSANDAAGHVVRLRSIDSCVLDRNVWNITSGPSAVGGSAFKLFWVRNCKFRDSRWNVTNDCTGACDEAGWFMQRDYTQSNSWARDTIDMGGLGDTQFFGSGSGSYPATVMNNNYDRLLVRLRGGTAYGGAMVYQDAARWDTLTNCTFVGSSSGLLMNGPLNGPILVDHCTIAAFSPSLGGFGADVGAGQLWVGTITLRNNIYFTAPTSPHRVGTAALYIPITAAKGHLSGNHNLVWTPMPVDSSMYLAGYGLSAPGVGKPFCNQMQSDSASVYGTPRFANSSSVANFDPHLTSGSAAIGVAYGGGDAGAISFSGTAPDTAAPSPVSSLLAASVASTSLVLEWAAPQDMPTLGPVAAYDLRYSNSPLNDVNFAAATPMSTQPVPHAPGAYEAYPVTGLVSGQPYFYALRSRDSAGNWSAVSNVASVNAQGIDTKPPAAVVDLSAAP